MLSSGRMARLPLARSRVVMLGWNLSVADMRLIVDIRDVLKAFGDAAPKLAKLQTALQERKHTLGNGMGRELSDLEEKLGGVTAKGSLLVDRRKTGAVMWPKGLEIAAKCEQILKLVDEMQAQAADGRQTLRLGVTNAVTTNMLPQIFLDSQFLSALPNIDFEIVDGESWELVTTLFTSLEFAIGSRDVIPGDCRAESLCWRKRVLLYSPQARYEHDYSQRVSCECLRDWLRSETLIVPDERVIPELKTFLHPMTTGHKIKLTNAAARRTWVERKVGLAISHEEKSPDLNDGDRIRTFDLSEVLGETELMLFFHKNRKLSPAAELLVKMIRVMFAEPPLPTVGHPPPHQHDSRFSDRSRGW
ncbi:MAG: LysR family transcriptional regulator substrate-binding protein [Planctomycetaceae bacterium]